MRLGILKRVSGLKAFSESAMLVETILKRVGMDFNGVVYTEVALRAAADGVKTFYDEEKKALVGRIELPEMNKLEDFPRVRCEYRTFPV